MKNLSFHSLLNAALATDMIVIGLLLAGFLQTPALFSWYQEFSIGAVIVDFLIIVIGILLAYYAYPYVFGKEYNIILFSGLAVAIQVVHDLLFAAFFYQFRPGSNRLVTVMQKYMNENKTKILLADALMILSTIGLERMFSTLSQTGQTILSIVLVYVTPYLVFST
uniref:Uncharacterized protein n=1 Tax=viral metagenome TaxID=1070528 RepID=A0A6C0KS14_9ZZZZ